MSDDIKWVLVQTSAHHESAIRPTMPTPVRFWSSSPEDSR